ncbi:cyclohexanone 1,2-monooxygenase [Diaporthe sp. PMI_573]|nr:cyclohexanone 1,2-monooxygenase [Diaporthaceae sp. PMI_573]KAH8746085.1 cyclohexanone 1,2-monooxygenase [Diaporthaceae sp. PMI_573]
MSQELIEKYTQERAKRLRPDGVAQYIDVRSKEIQTLASDPWVNYESEAIKNAPLKDGSNIKFLICGGGHSGILYAYRLIEAGFSSKDIVNVDIAGGFGGTWYWNRYPGLMCDVEGFVYLPLLEETGYVPKHKYSYGQEIRGQSERIAAKWGLQGQFCTKVDSQTWDEDKHQWVVRMTRTLGEDLRTERLTVYADFVVGAGGILSIPKIPKLKGWSEFRAKRHAFHTSRWDYAYTGGSQEKPDMTKLKGKVVALIGTGATAVQAVPELAKWAKHLYVVQRTPSYCGPRGQAEVTPEFWSKVADGPGWQNRRRRNFNSFITNNPEPVDLVNDGWTHVPGVSGTVGSSSKIVSSDKIGDHIQELLRVDSVATEELRARISREVKDQETAEKLKPWYGTWCKRPTFHDAYLPTFNRDNVTLIDTNGKGLDSLTENGIVFDGVEYKVDCLVLATGFVVGTTNNVSEKIGAPITGRSGVSFTEAWEKPGATTAFGLFFPGFPNFAATHYRGAGFSYNLSSVYDIFARLFAHVVATVHRQKNYRHKVVFDISEKATERWAGEVAARAAWFGGLSICTPGYYTDEGETFGKGSSAKTDDDKDNYAKARQALWGSGPVDYQLRTESYVAKEGNILEDFTIDVV